MKELWLKPEDGHPDRFDAVTQSWEPGDIIHLAPAVYRTFNTVSLKPGTRLIGPGAIIEQNPANPRGVVISSDIREDGHCSISGVTVRGNYSKVALDDRASMSGIILYGAGNSIEDVTVEDFGGTWETELEAFGIMITGNCQGATMRDIVKASIRRCEVSGTGTYDNGIVIAPGAGKSVFGSVAEGNFCHDIYPRDGDGHGSAFGMYGGLLTGNTSKNCQRGYYSESVDGLKIAFNDFLDCHEYGILSWGAQNNHDLDISHNLIESRGILVHLSERDGFPMFNVRIADNTFRGGTSGLSLPIGTGRRHVVRDNTFDSATLTHTIAPDAVCSGNRTTLGEMIPALPEPPLFALPDQPPKSWKSKLQQWSRHP